ncbi:MAG TPA: hypothetical protein DCM45_03575 [Clostridiales bacterium]|nr:hypothetical protein [Clostridiales bacterium]
MSTSSIRQLIKYNSALHEIISVYLNILDSQQICAGKVLAYDAEYFCIENISKHGRFDGFSLRRICDVFRIDSQGSYENRLMKLNECYKNDNENILDNLSNFGENDNLLKKVLQLAKGHQTLVSILLDNSDDDDLTGAIYDIQGHDITMSKVNFYGQNDGLSVIQIKNIVAIDYNTDDEKSIKLLMEGSLLAGQ